MCIHNIKKKHPLYPHNMLLLLWMEEILHHQKDSISTHFNPIMG